MENLGLSMRVNHPTFGIGTVKGLVRDRKDSRLLHIKFDEGNKSRFFRANNNSLIANMQEVIAEHW